MSTTTPYIHVVGPMMARRDVWPETPQGALTTETVQGYHAFWAARIPYIPAVPLADGLNANNRIGWQMSRQVRFLYDLAQIHVNSSTFELRYIADPRPGMEARVSLVLLGKVFSEDQQEAERIARGQWERVSALFPSEAPYLYPLAPTTEQADPAGVEPWEAESFSHWFTPIALDELTAGRYAIVELRKHEDWPQRPVALHDVDYIPHHFVPPIDYTGMTRLLDALSRQPSAAYIGVALRPQRLAPRERSEIARFSNYYARAAKGELLGADQALLTQRSLDQHAFDAKFLQRAELGKQVFGALNEQSEALALISVRVVAKKAEQTLLTQTMGSEIVANTGLEYPCAYDPVTPGSDAEFQVAMFNMRWLEMERWGISPRLQRFHDLWRLRFLVTMPEAVAAFRLPTALPGAYLHGIDVTDEPFTSVPTDAPQPDDVTGLGQVTTSGVALAIDYRLPRRAFSDGISLLGDESVERGEVAGVLLRYLTKRGIPVTVLGPHESPSMRGLLGGAGVTESRAASASDAPPPFTPPEGVTLVRWISAVARALALAYTMPTSASLALQAALTSAFVAAGGVPDAPWDPRLRAPETTEVTKALRQAATRGDLSAEMRAVFTDLLLPGLTELQYAPSLKRVQPESDGPVFLLSESVEMYQSAVARTALACASAAIALERGARAPQSSAADPPRGALLLVEPHLLFPATLSGDQPLLPLLEGLRQAQCGVITLTARPHLLDPQIFTGVIAAQRLTSSDSIAACQRSMRLSDREAQRLNALNARDTLWQRDGVTVLARRAPVEPGLRLGVPINQDVATS